MILISKSWLLLFNTTAQTNIHEKCIKETKQYISAFLRGKNSQNNQRFFCENTKEPPDHYMQNPEIILCGYKSASTPPCAQTMHHTHSYTLLFPLWHVLEVLDRSCTDLSGLCHLHICHLCQAQFFFKSQLSNVSPSQDAGPQLQAVSCWIFPCCHITPACEIQHKPCIALAHKS